MIGGAAVTEDALSRAFPGNESKQCAMVFNSHRRKIRWLGPGMARDFVEGYGYLRFRTCYRWGFAEEVA